MSARGLLVLLALAAAPGRAAPDVAPPDVVPPEVVVEGHVHRAGSSAPVAFAEVALERADASNGPRDGDARVVFTDDRGAFRVAVPPGAWTLTVATAGYTPLSLPLVVEPGASPLLLALSPAQASATLSTTVRGQGEPAAGQRLARGELSAVPGTAGDVLRTAESLPGVARAPLLGGALMVRGGFPADTGVFLDGVPVPILYHFGGFTSVVNGRFVEDLQLMQGGFPVRYGNATAGVVEVATHALDLEAPVATADVDLFDVGVFLGARAQAPLPFVRDLRVGVAARRSHVDGPAYLAYATAQAAGAPLPFLPVPVYDDHQAKLVADTDAGTFTAFAFGASDAWSVVGNAPPQNGIALDDFLERYAGSRFQRFGVRHEANLAPGVRHLIQPYVGTTTRGVLSSGIAVPVLSGGALDTPTDELNWGLRDELRATLWRGRGSSATVRLGLDHQSTSSRLAVIDVEAEPGAGGSVPVRLVDATTSATGVWGDVTLETDSGLTLIPGLRHDGGRLDLATVDRRGLYEDGDADTSTVPLSTLSPRLTLRQALFARPGAEPLLSFHAAFGAFHQPPAARDAVRDTDGAPLSSPLAVQASAGFSSTVWRGVEVDAQVYVTERRQLARELARTYDPDEPFPLPLQAPGAFDSGGTGDTVGAELFVRLRPSAHAMGFVSYTLSRTVVRLGDRREETQPHPFDQTHNLVAVGKVNLPWAVSAGARFTFVSGGPNAQAEALSVVRELNGDETLLLLSTLRPPRLPAYHRLDLRVDKVFWFPLCSITAFLEVINVYNWPNAELVAPTSDGRGVRTVLPGLPVAPLLGAEVTL